MRRSLMSISFVAFTAACGDSVSPSIRIPAYLGRPFNTIEAPDTARVGVPFAITAFAAGSSKIECNQPDGATVTPMAHVSRVEIFVRVPSVSLQCPDDIRYYPIETTVVFSAVGPGIIRVVGARASGVGAAPDSMEQHLVVIP